jgi:hypothetical protein
MEEMALTKIVNELFDSNLKQPQREPLEDDSCVIIVGVG